VADVSASLALGLAQNAALYRVFCAQPGATGHGFMGGDLDGVSDIDMMQRTTTRAAVRALSRPSQAAAAERGSVTQSVDFFAVLRVHNAPLTAWADVSAW
jgi:hypothetical protein